MGRLFTVSLEGKIYTCKYCGTHLALHEDVVSKFSKRKDGEAYLLNKVVNVTRGKLVDRMNMTGLHIVAVIFCVGCGAMIGSTYECKHENIFKCKEGNSILYRSSLSFQDPDGGCPRPNHEARVGGSDADDA